MNENIKLYNGDCLQIMDKLIKEGIKVDAIITDPPYGVTKCKWDSVIPFQAMWQKIYRLSNDRTPTLLFGAEPFSSALRMSNVKNYKYDWIWDKINGGNPFLVKIRPIIAMENIIIFYKKKPTYNPQLSLDNLKAISKQEPKPSNQKSQHFGQYKWNNKRNVGYPKNIIRIAQAPRTKVHPTQKPVALMEYLIKTYTNEGQVVLDFTMGSGTTGVACQNLNRKFIGIQLDQNYFNIAKERLEDNLNSLLQIQK